MKATILLMFFGAILFTACSVKEQNPFFSEYQTPFGTPPFDKIKESHYLPAFTEGISQHHQEILAIINNKESPTFQNTVEALENSGQLLTRVRAVFFNMISANTNDRMQKMAQEVSPMLSQHADDILLNKDLFKRIKTVYDEKDQLDLTHEQQRLLEETYKRFARNGANLDEKEKAELREINKELSLLTLKFGDNVLKETNKFELVIDKEADLTGLPENVISTAAETAKERGHEVAWVFTIQKPSMIPFLQYSQKRDLREKIFEAYINQGNHDDELDNKATLTRIAALRLQRANLLGYKTHADFVLEENMAKVPQNVYNRLNQIWKPALKVAQKEEKALQNLVYADGQNFKLEPWDWWYYAEKLKKQKYDLDDEVLRPYFKLENVREGAFMVANKLWGLTFKERTDIPTYNPDVKTFEVKDADGTHIGILYTDYFPRASKRGGAWMSDYRGQKIIDGKMVTPIVCNVFNFTKPTGNTPSLLTLEEAKTLFHEFGHGLHGLLSDCNYESISGTNVAQDFVELPSQIMENWASDPEVLKMYARHYETNQPIPDELIQKIRNASKFNQGFETVELLAASFLDMDWHTITDTANLDPIAFENKSLSKIGLIPEIVVRYRSPYFRHIFAGGYSAGYYSYIWAEVLDADAFQAFKETSIFDQATARSFRENILAAGNTEDPMVLYKKFRGREPGIDALLVRRGLN